MNYRNPVESLQIETKGEGWIWFHFLYRLSTNQLRCSVFSDCGVKLYSWAATRTVWTVNSFYFDGRSLISRMSCWNRSRAAKMAFRRFQRPQVHQRRRSRNETTGGEALPSGAC